MYPVKGLRNYHRKFVIYLKDQEDVLQEDQHGGKRRAESRLSQPGIWDTLSG